MTPPTLPSIEEVRLRKNTVTSDDPQVADLNDEKTPLPRRSINHVRRSESSDDEESLIFLTTSDQELEIEPHVVRM